MRLAGRGANRRSLSAAIITAGGVALIAVALLTMGFGPEAARDEMSTASSAPVAASAAEVEVHYHPGRPAHIHAGTCADLGDVAFPLNPVGAGTMTGAAMADVPAMAIGEAAGSSTAIPVEIGQIMLDVPLREIASGAYALNVQISEYDFGNYIACGDVGGVVANDMLTFGLAERNASGFSGLARLQADGETTRVSVYLLQGDGVTGWRSLGAHESRVPTSSRTRRRTGNSITPRHPVTLAPASARTSRTVVG